MVRRFALRAAPDHAPGGMFAEVNPGAHWVSIAETLAGRFQRHAGSVAMGAWAPSCLARNWLN